MAERKCVKLKVNMYEDTKFKIIDMKPERDLIHYIWTRLITLAGKVNLDGKLYMSRNIPYTIETLAIEFNRTAYQVKLALDVFMELEMIELTEDNIYIVKNFAKHQNIKPKETTEAIDKEKNIKTKENSLKENLKNKINGKEDEQSKNKISENKVEIIKDKEHEVLKTENTGEVEISYKNMSKITDKNSSNTDDAIHDEKINNNLQGDTPIDLKRKNKRTKNKKSENEYDKLIEFFDVDEERPLKEGENLLMAWSF